MKAIVVRPNSIELQEIIDLHAVLGGYLEALPVGEGFTVFIDEDGKAKELPRNDRADSIIRAMLAKVDRIMLSGDYIVGPAIFVGIDEEGFAVDLPDAVLKEYFSELTKA